MASRGYQNCSLHKEALSQEQKTRASREHDVVSRCERVPVCVWTWQLAVCSVEMSMVLRSGQDVLANKLLIGVSTGGKTSWLTSSLLGSVQGARRPG
jgi:hypothetical protein